MTIVKENFITSGLSGKYGNKVVFRQWKGRTIFAKPALRSGKLTPKQEERKKLFLEAVDYAALAIQDPDLKEAYRKMAPLGSSPHNMAIADYLKPPTVVSIDTGSYKGEPGNPITVTAVDNCRVKSVSVTIHLADGTLLEAGEAVQPVKSRVWTYTAQAPNPELTGCVVTASATDVPNHTGTGTVTL
jgi:hypothetical protein